MIHNVPEDEREDETVRNVDEQTPEPAPESEALEDQVPDALSDMTDNLMPQVPPVDAAGDVGLPGEPPATETETSLADSPAEFVAEGDAPVSSGLPPSTPIPFGQLDWSKIQPAPGYADPVTGRARFLTGRVDQAGLELSDFVLGRRPVFEPEHHEPGTDPAPQAPYFARSGGDEGGPYFPQQTPAAPAAVFVDVRVGLDPEAIDRVSKAAIRKAAEFSRGEIMVVARKLYDLVNDLKMREAQHRAIWGR